MKHDVIEMIEGLPEHATLTDITREIHLRLAVEHGLKSLDEGHGSSHEEVKERLKKRLS